MIEHDWHERRVDVAKEQGRNPDKLCDGKYWQIANCFYLRGGNCDCGKPPEPTLKSLAARVKALEALMHDNEKEPE